MKIYQTCFENYLSDGYINYLFIIDASNHSEGYVSRKCLETISSNIKIISEDKLIGEFE